MSDDENGTEKREGSKRACLDEDLDSKARAMLAMSRYCQERWVKRTVKLHLLRGESMKITLLSGDAGCGKSHAISMLTQKLRDMNVPVVVCAMTNKAAGTLMDSCSLRQVYTLHKAMGFKRELLDNKLSLDEFTRKYVEVHRPALSQFRKMYESDLAPEHLRALRERHSCGKLRPESCATCGVLFGKMKDPDSSSWNRGVEEAPPFVGANVLVVDEYGLMNVTLLDKMLACFALFYGPERGPLVVFAGSVSQLQPVGSDPRLWQTDRFERLLTRSTPLFVNRRQFEDPGYAEAVTYLQFNTVTEESRRIFRSQVAVGERELMDPDYQPEKLRVFHQDKQQATYTAAYLKKATETVRVGEKFLSVTKNRNSHAGPKAWYEVLKQAAQTLPKLFKTPAYRPGVRSTERDYLTIDKLWVGCRVRMIWHMDYNGIRAASAKSRSAQTQHGTREAQRRKQSDSSKPLDTEGVVEAISFKPNQQFNEFEVRGSQSGTLYKVAPSQWEHMNWTVTTHPLASLLAMNTYDCQGATIRGQVLYHPPKQFFMSPIKPSVYVTLTRVLRRDNLQMTNCNFAESVGTVRFYDDRLVTYRKKVEMNYSS